jgi:putative nucleotidyltransferase with HDIG domain
MKLKTNKKKLQNIFKILLALVVVFIIVELYPRESTFNYQFEEGKPWSYELMTAPFDFPIYKSDEQIEKEKKEILKNFTPYFNLDTTVMSTQLKKFEADWRKASNISPNLRSFIERKMKSIYSKGIISNDDYNNLQKWNVKRIYRILPGRISQLASLNEIYTPKTAYEELVKDGSENVRELNLNNYLVENLRYDSITSETAKNELLKNLSLTVGMVQTGERIIDKGEIVSPETYAILRSLQIEYENRKSVFEQTAIVSIGEILLVIGLITLLILYIYLFRPRILDNFNNLLFLSLLIVLIVALTSMTIRYSSLSYYIVPFALLPIIVRVFYDSRTALFVHIITVFIVSLMVDNPFQFVLLQITAGMVAVSSLKDMTQRSQLAQSALYIFLNYVGMYLAFELIAEGNLSRINWMPIFSFAISSLFLLFAYLLIYIFEKMFGLLSAVTLVELTNVNSDLLMKFAEVAPGTFQHSLQVSNLATEAAKKINANSLLVRTGALYHDIGKMKHPGFFTENQVGGKNPLLSMKFEEAARIIIEHVANGIEIAKKNHLPDQIINFIATHHGTAKAKYFYVAFINENPGVKPDEKIFSYSGPLPSTKETAILMMADAVEARSRTLSEYTEESIDQMVEDIINTQIAEGQFKDAPISFRDVETVKKVMKEKIKNIYHSRITYPEIKTSEE